MRDKEYTKYSRRNLIKTAGAIIASIPFTTLIGCGPSSPTNNADDTNITDTDIEDDVISSTEWLSGGTSSMLATFPPENDPFDTGLGNLCQMTDNFTIGPCYFDVNDERDDISEGEIGVPMILTLKLVDASCNPVEGAVIEVWWCNAEGLYSGDNSDSTGSVSSFSSGFCTDNDSNALSSRWFRGIKTSDADGNVYFKACFPGWYPSRTTHIHFRIVLNNSQQLISQFGFDDELCNNIYLNHEDYTGTAKDTSNSSDNVFNDQYENYLFETEQLWDGSMLAYKAIQINV